LRQVRPADLPHVIAFCFRHARSDPADPTTAMSAMRRGHIDAITLAWQDDQLVAAACCVVARHRAHLLELVVGPHIAGAAIERRLLRRTLQHLRSLGVESLDFSPARARPSAAGEALPQVA
jgi:hypothetical protein